MYDARLSSKEKYYSQRYLNQVIKLKFLNYPGVNLDCQFVMI